MEIVRLDIMGIKMDSITQAGLVDSLRPAYTLLHRMKKSSKVPNDLK
jgi:hypothetical protein